MFGVNPIGDPEMPIYTTTPQPIDNVDICYSGNSINVRIGGLADDYTICVMSTDDMGASYYDVRTDVQFATFDNVECDASICITKPNHIPYIARRGITYIQNENIVLQRNVTDNIVRIGENVTGTKPSGAVNIRGRATINGDIIELEDGVTITNRANVQLNNNERSSGL